MVVNKLANRTGAFIKVKEQNCNGSTLCVFVYWGCNYNRSVLSVEWGSVNSVGLHITEWSVDTCDLCVLLVLTRY